MRPNLTSLNTPLVWTALGAIGLSGLIWFLAPLAGIESDAPIYGLMALPPLCWVGFAVWRRVRAAKADGALADGLTDDARAVSDEEGAIRERFRKAIEALRAVGGGAGLRDMPWYVLIGPPGSGKTTALVNSGLRYPLEGELGRGAVKGVAGTRSCDWWFTDDAVLIDTAGRFTTQDSAEAVDKAGWDQFLALLARHRPTQPLNGIMLAVPVPDLVADDPAERAELAAAIRRRLRELTERFGERIPVYLLLTKCDLVAGFDEFFRDLGQAQREQVLGMTFPLAAAGAERVEPTERFHREFDLLSERVERRMLERVHGEPDAERRGRAFAFPAEFAALRDPLAAFIDAVFVASRHERTPPLRGVYLTSGTQTGTPMAQLMGALAAGFGVNAPPPPAFAKDQRSYFITRALRDVMFAEAGLVGIDPKVAARDRLTRAVALSAVGLLGAGVIGALAWSYFGNRVDIAAFEERARELTTLVDALPTAIEDGDLRRLLPVLERARALGRDGSATASAGPDLGLSRSDELANQGAAFYQSLLSRRYAPRLVYRAHQRLATLVADADPAADVRGWPVERTLTVLLHLAGKGNADPALMRDWLRDDLAADGYAPAEVAAAVAHLDALIPIGFAAMDMPDHAVDAARTRLRDIGPAVRAYEALSRSVGRGGVPAWNLIDAGGAETHHVFQRRSGAALTEGVPGPFTRRGFVALVLPNVPKAAAETRSRGWIFGDEPGGPPTWSNLERDVLSLYLAEYVRRWDALLGDLELVKTPDIKAQAALVEVLKGANSPMAALVRALADETSPTRVDDQVAGAALEAAASLVGADALKLARDTVDERFGLARFAKNETAGLGALIKNLELVNADLKRARDASSDGGGIPSGRILMDATAQLPYPVKGWMETLARRIAETGVTGARESLNAEWTTKGLPWCARVVDDRHPFVPGASREAGMDDFSRLFSPGGVFDEFFEERLKPYVDVTAPVWRWRTVEGRDLGISPSVLEAFQTARVIRDAFFPDGGKTPGARFDVTLRRLTGGAAGVRVSVDGRTVEFAAGLPQAGRVEWPGGDGAGQMMIAFQPPPPVSASPTVAPAAVSGVAPVSTVPVAAPSAPADMPSVHREGPWAFPRLLRSVGLRRTGDPSRFSFAVGAGGYGAAFELTAGSAVNPLSLSKLEGFRCPERL